jgi:hypothetical protein
MADRPGGRFVNHVDLSAVHLDKGGHSSREQGVCVMELVTWLAGQPHSDQPPCVSPVLRSFALRWNDDLDDATRQRLIPFAPRMVGTVGDGHDERRAWLLIDWQVRTSTPAWLRLAGLTAEADTLAASPEIVDHATLAAVHPDLDKARQRAAAAGAAAGAAARDAAGAAAGDAARAAAGAAARDAAGAAAGAAARDAAGDAARDAARDAAGAAARDAAGDAARDAARDAAGAAAGATLRPTVLELQESAFALLDRLLDPTAADVPA